MLHFRNLLLPMVFVGLLLICGCQPAASGGGGGGNGVDQPGQIGDACDQANPCVDGLSCNNGTCAMGADDGDGDGNGEGEGEGEGEAEPLWQQVLSDLPGALLSASGTSQTDVYAVGADGDGSGPMVVHFDGQQWTRLDTGITGDLWWITDRLVDDSFFMVGAGGNALRYRVDDGSFEDFTPLGEEILYGVWGVQPNNVVAVGGDPFDPETSGVIWHFDGNSWTQEDVTAINPNGIPVLFKVWGRSGSEIYACGANGTVLRFDGTSWTQMETETTRTLFTIHGNDDIVVACGGALSGVILELQGDTFVDVTPEGTQQMNGTFAAPDGQALTVGREGAVAFRENGGWQNMDTGLGLDPTLDYHGTWIDPAGGIWSVGGLLRDPALQGLLSYYGTMQVPTGLSN